MQPIPRWLIALAAALLIGLGIWLAWPAPPKPPLGRKQTQASQARVTQAQQTADRADTRAARADAAATTATAHATTLRHATHSLPARHLPKSPAAESALADSLTRVLTNY